MRFFSLTAVTAAGWLLWASLGLAEEQGSRRQLGALQELDPGVRTLWEAAVTLDVDDTYTLLRDRVVVLAQGGKTLDFFDLAGKARGRVPLSEGLAGLAASPRGDRILGSKARSEDKHVATVFGADGRPRWSRTLDSPLRFTASGSFLLTEYDALDSSQAPAALRADTGEVAWTDTSNPSYWSMAAAANDTLAYYQPGRLQLIRLEDKRVLWEKALPTDRPHDLGDVRIALDGKTIVVRTRLDVETDEKSLTVVLDDTGRLLWERRVEIAAAPSGAGAVTAISQDGAFLAQLDSKGLSILRSADGQTVSRVEEPSLCCIVAFTDRMLALSRREGTRIFRLSAGVIDADLSVPDPIRFVLRAGRYAPILVRAGEGGVTLSELDLDLRRAGGK